MPTIGAAVNAATKAQFDIAARDRQTTASRLAALLIREFLVREYGATGSTPPSVLPPELSAKAPSRPDAHKGAKTEQVFVRLHPYYFAELQRLADERRWYRSTYLANLFQAHADQQPVLCHAEIDALRQIARQLAEAGRTMNWMADCSHASSDHLHRATSLDLSRIRTLIALESVAVQALIRANLRGWGVQDVEK